MTKYESEEIIKEKKDLAYKLINEYGERAKSLCEHLTGRRDLLKANILCLNLMDGVLGRKH